MLTTSVVLIILAAVLGTAVFVSLIAWFANRLQRLESGGGGASEIGRLESELDDLRAELQQAHADISDLSERLDFTERLLSPGDESDS